eukprot:480273-Ditylum_brightwellii.AAC.2
MDDYMHSLIKLDCSPNHHPNPVDAAAAPVVINNDNDNARIVIVDSVTHDKGENEYEKDTKMN